MGKRRAGSPGVLNRNSPPESFPSGPFIVLRRQVSGFNLVLAGNRRQGDRLADETCPDGFP